MASTCSSGCRDALQKKAICEDVKLYFCETHRGESSLVPLNLDMFGSIDNWPKNFMGDAFGETLAAEKARLKRMQANR
ncbi:MAG: DUF3696 domain-containing protein [Alphaproteobacteria bacterium]|nr:DUF3696 domain-containing protein [Alphaproteobacteria bacterium]